MSIAQFNDDCPGCRPAVLDPTTGHVLPPEHPVMVTVNSVWATTTLEERRAFHNVCCLNSRTPEDLKLVAGLNGRIQAALNALEASSSQAFAE
jgi:hypothetical protein